MKKENDAAYIWVTWLTKYLVGRNSCLWTAWFRANHQGYDKMPSNFDTSGWLVDHTNFLDKVHDQYIQRFPVVRRELQNSFQFKGKSGAVVAGKPDLIGYNDNEFRICDVKTGQRQDEHWAQMLLYMHYFPRCFPDMVAGREVVGELIYKDGKQEVYMEEFTMEFETKVLQLLRTICSNQQPDAIPSYYECKDCCITSVDCASRVDSPPESGQVELGDF